MSVFIIRAFLKNARDMLGTREVAKKFEALEKQLTNRLDAYEVAIVRVLQEVMQIINPPPASPPAARPKIGFNLAR